MLIAPIIFCTVVLGVAGTEDMKKVGKTGGVGMSVDPASLDTKGSATYTGPEGMGATTGFLFNITPNTMVDPFAKGEILQVLFTAVLFGFALHQFGDRGTLAPDLIEKAS